MRKSLFVLVLLLVGCGGNSVEPVAIPIAGQLPARHAPEITSLALFPNAAVHMEGNGSVTISAEIAFSDAGSDLQTLWVRMPGGTTISLDEPLASETGTFSEALTMSTAIIGEFELEFWLVDQAGDSSDQVTAQFHVVADVQTSDWTNRLSGLPDIMSDVIWDGSTFIAVGGDGVVLTSADGIDWVARESGTEATLYALGAYGSDIFAVGKDIVLQSTDHGETWVTRTQPDAVYFFAVAASSSHLVVGGRTNSLDSIIMISEDRGASWQVVDPWPDQFLYVTDLAFRDGHFVAAADTMAFNRVDGGWVFVSSDGARWDDVFRDPESGYSVIVDDGSRFTVAGSDGAVITSFDGFNWTELQTPVVGVEYHSAAWNGSKMVIAGGYPCFLQNCNPPDPPLPYGIASTDGGATWDMFNIDGHYRSLGMAYGNGRFVSVGVEYPGTVFQGVGAIYTSD
jgi:hypothetical protein